jgi:hypothetical protein
MVPHGCNLLEDFVAFDEPKVIELAGHGNFVEALGSGTFFIGEQKFRALSVENLQFCIISESSMVEKGAIIIAREGKKTIYNSSGREILVAPLRNRLFVITGGAIQGQKIHDQRSTEQIYHPTETRKYTQKLSHYTRK